MYHVRNSVLDTQVSFVSILVSQWLHDSIGCSFERSFEACELVRTSDAPFQASSQYILVHKQRRRHFVWLQGSRLGLIGTRSFLVDYARIGETIFLNKLSWQSSGMRRDTFWRLWTCRLHTGSWKWYIYWLLKVVYWFMKLVYWFLMVIHYSGTYNVAELFWHVCLSRLFLGLKVIWQ